MKITPVHEFYESVKVHVFHVTRDHRLEGKHCATLLFPCVPKNQSLLPQATECLQTQSGKRSAKCRKRQSRINFSNKRFNVRHTSHRSGEAPAASNLKFERFSSLVFLSWRVSRPRLQIMDAEEAVATGASSGGRASREGGAVQRLRK
jgi:hypothetical protein